MLKILLLGAFASTLGAEEQVPVPEVDLYTAERAYVEQEVGARFDPTTGKRRYDNYEIIKVNPETEEHLKVLRFLEKGLVELWNPLTANLSLANSVDIILSPDQADHVKKYLECSGMQPETVIQDLQKEIDQENIPSDETEEDGLVGRPGYCYTRTGMTWNQYHRWNTFNNYLDCLVKEHSDKVEVIQIGKSSQGRNLRVLKLGHPSKIFKPAIWIDGGIHAREWVSPASVLYILRELVENEDPNNSLLNFFDIYILPVVNPDGYEYTHEVDRMWRKTRSTGQGGCVGVDPNRNWGYKWGGEGASTNPCSETYRGPRPFSEPETAAVRDFIMARNHQIKLYLTFHSYGQYVLYPWGYGTEDSTDVKDLHSLGLLAANAISKSSGRTYSVGSAAKLLWPAAGGSDDWAKGGAGIKYSYTIELPDQGRHGFILPAQYIESVGKEAYAAVQAMLKFLQQ